MGRAARDKKRLAQLTRQARADKDKEARGRYKQTVMLIKLKSLRFEGKPLLCAILPVAILATWAFGRLAYEPPTPGETYELRLYLPNSDIGTADRPYLLKQEGIEIAQTETGGALQEVVRDTYPTPEGWWDELNDKIMPKPALTGVARWKIKALGQATRHTLKIYHKGTFYEKDFRVDGRHHPTFFDFHDDGNIVGIELAMKPAKLFGQVGGILFLQPWLVAYLLIAIPAVYIIKPLCKIY